MTSTSFVCASKSLFPQSCVSSGGSMMGLMVTSSKRAYATPRSVAAPVGLEAKFQQYVSHELPDVQAGFRKGRGTRDQIANIHIANIRWIIEKARSSRKTSISALLTMPKPLTVWITINCGKF